MGRSPQFSAHVGCGQLAASINMPLGMEVGLVPSDFVLDWNPAPPPRKGGGAPNFRPMSIVPERLDGSRWNLAWRWASGDPATLSKKGAKPPNFSPFLLWPNGWMHQDATWYGGRPQPKRLCVRCGPSSPSKREHSPQFLAHVYSGQTAGWISMELDMEVGLW